MLQTLTNKIPAILLSLLDKESHRRLESLLLLRAPPVDRNRAVAAVTLQREAEAARAAQHGRQQRQQAQE